jgi:hypothetical protein
MQTVVDINNSFEKIVQEHIQLQKFYTHSIDQMDIDKIDVNLFPFLYAQVTGMSIDAGVTVFTYEVTVADLVIEETETVVTQVFGETALIMQDVIAAFSLNVNSVAVTLGLVPDAYNSLSGWSCSFDIRVPNALNLCDALYTT